MVKIREGVVRVVIGLVVAGVIGAQIPHVNSVALAAASCPSIGEDADNKPLGMEPRDLALTALGVDIAVGVIYGLSAHHAAATTTASNNEVSSPFAQKQVQRTKAIKPSVAVTAR